MSSYFVDFVAYVDRFKLPVGFPEEVHLQETFTKVESTEHLQFLVNERFKQLVMSKGLIVLINPEQPLETGHITFDKRRFIPWHMLTHMELKVQLIPEPTAPQDNIAQSNPEPDKTPREWTN
jgi:hypothetical protein